MADVTGPVSTLRGAIHRLPQDTMCDEHPEVVAYKRVVGETDSFGSELIDMCKECFEKYQQAMNEPTIGCCEWCKTDNVVIIETRDFDEGMAGPVYDVCKACRKKQNDRAQEELDEMRADNDHEDDFGDMEEEPPTLASCKRGLPYIELEAQVYNNKYDVPVFELRYKDLDVARAKMWLCLHKDQMREVMANSVTDMYVDLTSQMYPGRDVIVPPQLTKNLVYAVARLVTSKHLNRLSTWGDLKKLSTWDFSTRIMDLTLVLPVRFK
jgi:hypothetical protein